MRIRIALLALSFSVFSVPALAQPYPSKFTAALADQPAVKQALAYLDEKFDDQVAEWIRITEIPAQSTFEQARGAYVRAELEKLGLDVSVDEVDVSVVDVDEVVVVDDVGVIGSSSQSPAVSSMKAKTTPRNRVRWRIWRYPLLGGFHVNGPQHARVVRAATASPYYSVRCQGRGRLLYSARCRSWIKSPSSSRIGPGGWESSAGPSPRRE